MAAPQKAPPSVRDALESAYQQHAGAPDGDTAGDTGEQPGQGPITRDAFSYQDQAQDPQSTCGNCQFFEADESGCGLYDQLNQALPQLFSLDPSTSPQAWCKAHVDGEADADASAAAQQQPQAAPGAPQQGCAYG
jgi:hypothetical protein